MYKVPLITLYKLTLLFIKSSSAESKGRTHCSLYIIIGDIPEDSPVQPMTIIVSHRVLMLRFFKVFWMKELLTPYPLPLSCLEITYAWVFSSRKTCVASDILNFITIGSMSGHNWIDVRHLVIRYGKKISVIHKTFN